MLKSSRTGGFVLGMWTIAICIVSQLPYLLVWRGLSTFPYDAFTTFNPWFVGQLAELRAGEGVFAMYQDEVPFDVWPSYFFTGILRQLFALLQANSAIGHAVVQAVHALFLVPATALLSRSMGVPWRYGAVGGLVFALSGIHVSLAHHVLAHEALLYLVLSLYGTRELVLGWGRFNAARRLLAFGLSGVVLTSLVRVHHEAILYVIPLAMWAAGHLVVVHRRSGHREMLRTSGVLAGLGALIALASTPMLLTAYELSLINKTAIDSYQQLSPYFSDSRAFFAGLILPGFTGGNVATLPATYSFHQEATLSYVFLGALAIPLLTVVIGSWWQVGRRAAAVVLLSSIVVVVGYTIGAGSPIHRALCIVFPFLIKIGHNYYGLHLLYLLAAYVVAEGLRLVVEHSRYRLLALGGVVQLGLVSYFARAATPDAGWRLAGSMDDFARVVQGDVRWHIVVAVLLAFLVLAGGIRVRGRSALESLAGKAGTLRVQALVLLALTVLVAVDLLRPLASAHFVPDSRWVEWATSPLGGFNPSSEVRRFLNAQQSAVQRPLRVVPVFPKGGGWQGNALMVTDVHLVGMPGDSGGNRHVEAWLSQPDPARIAAFVDRFGIDVIWVARWGVDEWAAALAGSGLTKVFSSAYGGDVYMRPASLIPQASQGVHDMSWRLAESRATMEQGLVTRTWRFGVPAATDTHARVSVVRLPLMWHAGYGAVFDGQGEVAVATGIGADGTLQVTLPAQFRGQEGAIVVRYPNRPLAILVALAAAVYVALLVLALLGAVTLRRSASTRRWRRHAERQVGSAGGTQR